VRKGLIVVVVMDSHPAQWSPQTKPEIIIFPFCLQSKKKPEQNYYYFLLAQIFFSPKNQTKPTH